MNNLANCCNKRRELKKILKSLRKLKSGALKSLYLNTELIVLTRNLIEFAILLFLSYSKCSEAKSSKAYFSNNNNKTSLEQ